MNELYTGLTWASLNCLKACIPNHENLINLSGFFLDQFCIG